MFFIIGVIEFDEIFGAKGARCFGYRTEFNVAEQLVLNNVCDINETIYDYVVIEKIGEGIHPIVENEWFYKFDYEKGVYESIEKPKETEHFCNYALG